MEQLFITIAYLQEEIKSLKVQQTTNCQRIDLHESNIKIICENSVEANNVLIKTSDKLIKIDAQIVNHKELKIINSEVNINIKCKWYNQGYCREKSNCLFFHAMLVCESVFTHETCKKECCDKRHPKICKNWINNSCKFGQYCKFLHYDIDEQSNEESIEEKIEQIPLQN